MHSFGGLPYNVAVYQNHWMTMDLQKVLKLTEKDMQQVNSHLRDQLNSEVVLINQIAEYIIANGGKRLRPMLMMLFSKAFAFQGQQHINLAAVIELIHTATLLHDDVVDESDMRRGEKTSHEIWGNAASVLVGDFLYSKSFQMMVSADDMRIMSVLANATNRISEGEVQQLLNIGNLDITEAAYYQIIENKTAKLFEAACELSAILADLPDPERQQLAAFGMHLGAAFQLADDVLDYTADAEDMGKNLGDDFAEGKLTLPLIYILKNGSEIHQQLIQTAIKDPEQADFKQIKAVVTQSGAIAYTEEQAKDQAEKAKACLAVVPESEAKDALMFLCDYAWQRKN